MKTRKTILMTILAMTLILSSQLVKAQFPKDEETGKVKFTGVVDLPGMSKDVIFKKAQLWIVTTLKSGDNMVELNGVNSDHIIGAGTINLDSIKVNTGGDKYSKKAYLNFKFIVFYKDNKLKYIVENFSLHYTYHYVIGASLELTEIDTELEDIATPEVFSKKDKIEFTNKSTDYIKGRIGVLVNDFISSMKKSESNEW